MDLRIGAEIKPHRYLNLSSRQTQGVQENSKLELPRVEEILLVHNIQDNVL